MAAVIRLGTVVDIDDRTIPAEGINAPVVDCWAPRGAHPTVAPSRPESYFDNPHDMLLYAVRLAVLDDGRRLTLLDDRGWGVHGSADIWHRTSVEEVEADARIAVGPDDPYGSHSQADLEADHWADLAGVLRKQNVFVAAEGLSRLPHDVELSERLHTKITST